MRITHYRPNLFDAVSHSFFPASLPSNVQDFLPRVDVHDEDQRILVSAELPGLKAEDLKVEVKEGVLSITGEKKSERSQEENGIFRAERSYGQFQRSFQLGDLVNAENISADLQNGVLTLELPKRPEAAPRQIAVKSNNAKVQVK